MPLDVIQKQEVSIAGNYSCIISGCLHIEEYAKENITVKSTEGRVCVYGDNLVIVSFLDDRVTVRGKIVSVEIRKGDTI